LGERKFRATYRREAGQESAGGIMWRGHRHRG
jgi:hypothetical protein